MESYASKQTNIMMSKLDGYKGYIYLLLFILSIPFGSILTSNIGKNLNISLLVFISTLWCVLIFHLINLGKNIGYYKKITTDFKRYSFMQLNVVLMWGGTFILPIYYSPFIELFSYFAMGAFIGYLVNFKAQNNRRACILLFLASALLVSFFFLLYKNYSIAKASICIVIIFLTALGSWFYKATSYKTKELVPSSFIIASRFYGLLVLSFVGLLVTKWQMPSIVELAYILFAASINLVLPVYFSQRSIRTLSPAKHSIVSSAAPFLVLIIQLLINHQQINQVNLLFSMLLIFILIYGTLCKD